jgi:hypothetical protein
MGIGFAAIREIVSFLRHATKDNPLAPQERPCIRYALGFGISQSGRVLRDLVYLGFNQDLAGRQVFDGILPVWRDRAAPALTGSSPRHDRRGGQLLGNCSDDTVAPTVDRRKP